jgi:hypothetical protein
MADPRFTRERLWEQLRTVWITREKYYSLVHHNTYVMLSLGEAQSHCTLKYESGRVRAISFDELYALYAELYKNGSLSRSYLRDPETCQRVIGRRHWGPPGAAMYALLPLLDDKIAVEEGGHLLVER